MTSSSDHDLAAATAELSQAIRREQRTLGSQLSQAIRRDHRRRQRRRKATRTSAISLAAALILSSSAIAAGDALGVIELGGGASATRVSSLPVWNGKIGAFVTGGNGNPYIYQLTGATDPSLTCDVGNANNIYVTSTRPLTATELKEIFDHEASPTTTLQAITAGIKDGTLPGGGKLTGTARHPIGSGSAASWQPPAGVTGISNGCPTPGVAGQPGSPSSPTVPGNAGVAVAPSGR